MRRWPRRAGLVLATIAAALVAGAAGVAIAAFSSRADSTANSIAAAPDWVAPTAAAAALAKEQGGVAGHVAAGGTYRVYATVSDSGNPPSGTSSVTADVSALTLGETAAPLTAGSFTVGGATYNHRSGPLTANVALVEGNSAFELSLGDNGGSSRTQSGFSAVVDNTPPSASDVQTANGAGTAGQPDLGDRLTLAWSEPIDAGSILAGWTGASTEVVVRIVDGGLGNDRLQVWNAANSAQLPLGSVDLGGSYVAGDRTYGVGGTASTIVQDGSSIRVTLGTASGGSTVPLLPTTLRWTPSASAYDRAGNAALVTARDETGAADLDF